MHTSGEGDDRELDVRPHGTSPGGRLPRGVARQAPGPGSAAQFGHKGSDESSQQRDRLVARTAKSPLSAAGPAADEGDRKAPATSSAVGAEEAIREGSASTDGRPSQTRRRPELPRRSGTAQAGPRYVPSSEVGLDSEASAETSAGRHGLRLRLVPCACACPAGRPRARFHTGRFHEDRQQPGPRDAGLAAR
jgi:hypothetical protein